MFAGLAPSLYKSVCAGTPNPFVALLQTSRSWVHSSGLGVRTVLWLVGARLGDGMLARNMGDGMNCFSRPRPEWLYGPRSFLGLFIYTLPSAALALCWAFLLQSFLSLCEGWLHLQWIPIMDLGWEGKCWWGRRRSPEASSAQGGLEEMGHCRRGGVYPI